MNEELSHLSSVKKRSLNKIVVKKIIFSFLAFLVFALLVVGGYFTYQYWNIQKGILPQKASQEEIKRLTTAVGKHMLLPTNETPTIGTITDIKKLKGQTFFDKAKNGDKILIYTNTKEAILYSPSKDIILGVAPITIGGQQPSQTSIAHLGLRNGTDSSGLLYKVEADIQRAFPGANVVLKDQAKRTDYLTTIVIPLSDAANGAASELAKAFNATVSTLPATEPKPSGVDILVILGKDRL